MPPVMVQPFWSQIEAVAAGLAAQYLSAHRIAILSELGTFNDTSVDEILAATEAAEPSGLKMALIKGTLNQMLSGLSETEKAAFPKGAANLFDYIVNKLSEVAQPHTV